MARCCNFIPATFSVFSTWFILFGFIRLGLQFHQQHQEGVPFVKIAAAAVKEDDYDDNNAAGITNLADVVCGKQLAKRKAKIVGGTEAYSGEFPWIVSIKEMIEDSGEQAKRKGRGESASFGHICGGTILNKRYILSAAHCFAERYFGEDASPLNHLRITLGEYDLSIPETLLNSTIQDVRIESITIHPKFDMRRYVHDVAIIKLAEDIPEWNNYIWPACIANDEFILESDLEQDTVVNATVAGWGSLVDIVDDESGEFPNILQRTTVPILNNLKCQKWFQRKGIQWAPKETHLCAGYPNGGFDSCRGDSGGPIFINTNSSNNEYVVIGIVAAGKGCARPFLPGVYTRIDKYMDWIIPNTRS